MSVDYFAKNGGYFSCSFVGADMLGGVHRYWGFPCKKAGVTIYRVPYEASNEEAVHMADLLSQKTDEDLCGMLPQIDEEGCPVFWGWGKWSPQEVVARIRRWEHFLRISGGYLSEWSLEDQDYETWVSREPDWSESDDYLKGSEGTSTTPKE